MTKRYLGRNIVAVIQQLNADGSGAVSSLEVAERLGESRTTVGRYLNGLVENGRVARTGSGRATRYELVDLSEWMERRANGSAASQQQQQDGYEVLAAYQAYEAARVYAARLALLVAEKPRRRTARGIGIIVVTPDNVAQNRCTAAILGVLSRRLSECRDQGLEPIVTTVGELAEDFARSAGLRLVSSIGRLRSASKQEGLIGAMKVQADHYLAGRLRGVHLIYASFIDTTNHGVVDDCVLPVHSSSAEQTVTTDKALTADLVRRYLEASVLRSVCETLAREAAVASEI